MLLLKGASPIICKPIYLQLKRNEMQQNLISAILDDAAMNEAVTHIEKVMGLLKNVLVNMEPQDRLRMAKMGDKTLAFVGKTLEYATQNEQMVPVFINLPEAYRDLQLTTQMNTLAKLLAPLCQSVEDTAMLAGSDAYVATLGIYGNIKGAAANNVAGATTIAEDLGKRFPGKGRKKQSE